PELDPAPAPEEGNADELAKPFRNFAVWKRVLVVLAGVWFYIIFAWCVLVGSLNAFGIPSQNVVVHGLSSTNHIAADAGMKAGDRLLSFDSKSIGSVDDAISEFRSHADTV